MKLAQLIFKPKWQDKNPATRRNAVSNGNEPTMIAALPGIARTDADSTVRLAALRRLHDYESWRERSTADADGEIRLRARNEYLALLCSNADGIPPLRRRIAELDTLTATEVEKVATLASDRDLRVAALGRVTRVGLLAERAITDPDPQLRLAVLELIPDASILERIAERARKTDKAVSRNARARLEAMRFDAGDTHTLNERARVLCERIEALMRSPGNDVESVRLEIERSWQALKGDIAPDLAARYRGADLLVQQTLTNARAGFVYKDLTLPAEAHIESALAVEHNAPAGGPVPEPKVDIAHTLASKARFDAALAAAAEEARCEQERHQALLHIIEERIPHYGNALEAGDITAAHGLNVEISTHVATLAGKSGHLDRRLAPLHERYSELKQWQQWSNQQRRKALCAEIEALAGTGAHPDALATRVREAREEWQRLDVSEGAATRIESGMARRFQGLCQRVLKPTRSYFDKRSELRDAHQEQLQALLDRVDAWSADSVDWKALTALRLELGSALRTLDGVDPRTRTSFAKRLKAAIAMIVPRIEVHEQEIEKARRRLIELAGALSQSGAQKNAAREVRELQQQWTALGQGKRAADQRQWREFRVACDAVFGKLDSERKEKETQAGAARQQTLGLVEEFETLAADDSISGDRLKSALRDLDSRWQASKSGDRGLEQRQLKGRDAVTARIVDLARQQNLSRFTIALEKYSLLRDLETGAQLADAVATRWDCLPVLIPEFAHSLDLRYARAIAATIESLATGDAGPAQELLVRLEFLAGLASPAENRQLRMDYQVQRLSARMRGGAAVEAPSVELTALIAQWFELDGPFPSPIEARFLIAAKTAIEALP